MWGGCRRSRRVGVTDAPTNPTAPARATTLPHPASPCSAALPMKGRDSSDDVGRQLVFELGDLVAQREFLLLQAGDLQLVGHGQGFEGADGVVEVLVLFA